MLSWRFKYSFLSAFFVCPTETYKTYMNHFSSLILKDQIAFSLLQYFSECSCLSSTKRFQSIQRKAYVWLWDKYTWTSCVVCVLVPSHIWNSKESKFKNITALRFIFDRLFPHQSFKPCLSLDPGTAKPLQVLLESFYRKIPFIVGSTLQYKEHIIFFIVCYFWAWVVPQFGCTLNGPSHCCKGKRDTKRSLDFKSPSISVQPCLTIPSCTSAVSTAIFKHLQKPFYFWNLSLNVPMTLKKQKTKWSPLEAIYPNCILNNKLQIMNLAIM